MIQALSLLVLLVPVLLVSTVLGSRPGECKPENDDYFTRDCTVDEDCKDPDKKCCPTPSGGMVCRQPAQTCSKLDCGPNATCYQSSNSSLPFCDNCNPNQCQDGGTCKDGVDSHSCTCPDGFTGDNCEIMMTIRLVNGNHPREGRVEIYYNGVWGTVCDERWDVNDAVVACRQLGFSSDRQQVAAFSWAYFGQGPASQPIWLVEVSCTGTESDLLACPALPLGSPGCYHDEDAGVSCPGSPLSASVRLVGGNVTAGRVEISLNEGAWGTVCDDFWDNSDAAVICRMLGFSGGTAVINAYFGHGTGGILLNNVDCVGTESSILQCPNIQPFGPFCGGDAGVVCVQGR